LGQSFSFILDLDCRQTPDLQFGKDSAHVYPVQPVVCVVC